MDKDIEKSKSMYNRIKHAKIPYRKLLIIMLLFVMIVLLAFLIFNKMGCKKILVPIDCTHLAINDNIVPKDFVLFGDFNIPFR